jgi:hypothetical protein
MQVVDDLHAKLHAAATAEERSAKLRRQLEMRAMTRSQKKVWLGAVVHMHSHQQLIVHMSV